MKILILWAPLADYTIACFRQLALKEDVEIFLVCQPSSSEAADGTKTKDEVHG